MCLFIDEGLDVLAPDFEAKVQKKRQELLDKGMASWWFPDSWISFYFCVKPEGKKCFICVHDAESKSEKVEKDVQLLERLEERGGKQARRAARNSLKSNSSGGSKDNSQSSALNISSISDITGEFNVRHHHDQTIITVQNNDRLIKNLETMIKLIEKKLEKNPNDENLQNQYNKYTAELETTMEKQIELQIGIRDK